MKLRTVLVFVVALYSACGPAYVPNFRQTTAHMEAFAEREPRGAPRLRCRSPLPLLNRVVEKIARATGTTSWCVNVVENPAWNAFVTPDRYVVVYTGLLRDLRTEGELAAVIGHEIGHVVFAHGAARQQRINEMRSLLALAEDPAKSPQRVLQRQKAIAALYELLVYNQFSQAEELQADAFGIYALLKAGYSPVHAIRVWHRQMKQNGEQGTVTPLTSTHPISGARVVTMMRALASYYENR